MSCRWFDVKPLSEPKLAPILNMTIENNIQWNSNQNKMHFSEETAPESVVCRMLTFLPSSHWADGIDKCQPENAASAKPLMRLLMVTSSPFNRGCCRIGPPPHLKVKSRETPFVRAYFFSLAQRFWNFAPSTAVILSYSVQNFKTIKLLKGTNDISRDLSLRWVLDWNSTVYRLFSLSGEPDYFGRKKISSGGDLSHYSSASLY